MIRQICSTCIFVLGLNSLVFDFVEFFSFVISIQLIYNDFRSFIFSFLPLPIAPFVQNYLIIGAALSSSYIRSDYDHPGPLGGRYSAFPKLIGMALGVLFGIIIWPVLLIANVLVLPMAIRGEDIADGLVPAEQPIAFLKNAAISVAFFVVFLFVFSDFGGILI